MKRQFFNLFCGLSLGALVGVIIGLSISEVVGIVLGALTSILVTFLGLKDRAMAGMVSSRMLIAGFSCSCIAGLFTGLYLRTHDALSPSVEYYLTDLEKLHLDSGDIKQIVLLKRYGIEWKGEQMKNGIQDKVTDTAGSKNEKPKSRALGTVALIETSKSTSSTLFNAKDSPDEIRRVTTKYSTYSLDQLRQLLHNKGWLFDQFYNNVTDAKDTGVQKNIIIQLIAITYAYSKN